MFVAASEPTCSVNISLPGNAVHESDFVEINCTTDYRGSWMPVVNCKPTSKVPVKHVSETSRSFHRISYVAVMAAADIGNWAVMSCETRFVLMEWLTPASQHVETVPDTPRYPHTWHSWPIHVFNTTGNTLAVQVDPSKCQQ